jgi:hypothetical protein
MSLPVRCTIVQGVYVGSCTYNDFCREVVQDLCEVTPFNCPPEMAEYGFDCSCPFNVLPQTFDGAYSFEIPDFSVNGIDSSPVCPFFFFTGHGFLANGDFDVKISVSDASNHHVACYRFLFTMTKA